MALTGQIALDGRRYEDCGQVWPTCLRDQADMMGLTDWSIESYGGSYWLMPPAGTIEVRDPRTGAVNHSAVVS